MALESATYINQLVNTNPTLADPKGQGDDHLRMIKRVLQQTFPGLTGPVTATQAQLNFTTDATKFLVPNMIIMWGGTVASIPTGWKLCNGSGTTSTGLAVPDLRDRFIVGAGPTWAQGVTGGTLSHSHTITVAGTALTVAQMPAHSHTYNQGQVVGTGGIYASGDDMTNVVASTIATSTVGSGATHTHTASSNTMFHIPPFYSMAFIIKN